VAGGNGKKSMKARKRAAQLKAAEYQKAAEKKARFKRFAPRPDAAA
jgi:hypothetical protein